MTKDKPTALQWRDLALIARNVELIIADAPRREGQTEGLLGIFFVKEPELPLNAGKLYNDLHHGTLLGRAEDSQRIVEILPGADVLGTHRGERLAVLNGRMVELPAYRWLMEQAGYKRAVSTLRRKATSQNHPMTLMEGYAIDTLEFLLLDAIVWPVCDYQIYSKHGYFPPFPTRAEMEDAAKKATALHAFLTNAWAVNEIIEIPYGLEKALAQVGSALANAAPNYVKPRLDSTSIERRFVDAVIKRCDLAFGECSNTLIRSILDVIDFAYDEASLKRKIKMRRSGRQQHAPGGLDIAN